MEQFILHRNLEYLVNLENRLITCADVYKNRNNNGPFYNIPQSNDHPLFKKIKELEERYGYLEYIPQKERLITEKIDKIIERVKTL